MNTRPSKQAYLEEWMKQIWKLEKKNKRKQW